MQPTVDPTQTIATHHILLSDEAASPTQLGLILLNAQGNPDPKAIQEVSNPVTALRVAQGAGGAGDFEQPYTPVTQADWSGGRDQEKFEQDATKYYDGTCIDTSQGKIIPAGQKHQSGGYGAAALIGSRLVDVDEGYGGWGAVAHILDTAISMASSFVQPSTFLVRTITLKMMAYDPTHTFYYLFLRADSGGFPGSILAGPIYFQPTLDSYAAISSNNVELNYTLVSGTRYHLEVLIYTDQGYGNPRIKLEKGNLTGASISKPTNSTRTTWANYASNETIVFRLNRISSGRVRFFEMHGVLHVANQADDQNAPTIYRNGLIGTAKDNTNLKAFLLTDLDLTTFGSLAGKTIRITAGPGVNETQTWRTIIGNTNLSTGNTILVSPPWSATHTTATIFVITEIDYWVNCPVTDKATGGGHPIRALTDLEVIDDALYLAQGVIADVGSGATVISIRMTVTSTGPTYEGTDEGIGTDLIESFIDTDGKRRIISTINNTRKVYKSEVNALLSTRTALNNDLAVGADSWRITGMLAPYGEPPLPVIFCDNLFGTINNGVFSPTKLEEMSAVRNGNVGKAAIVSNRFLYFSLGEGIERYYEGILDDVGPDRGTGLPTNRQGPVSDMAAYPGGIIYACIDAGDQGYSSILRYNGQGWTEVYRAVLGLRIRQLYIQNIAGMKYQRLWFSEEEDLAWIPIAKNPLLATGFTYAADCSIELSWMYTAYKDIQKFWNSLKLFAVNLSATKTITGYYRTDANSAYTQFGVYNDPSQPSEEDEFNSSATNVNLDVTGNRLQIKLALHTDDSLVPVYVETALVEAVTRIPAKKAWNITARISDYSADLTGTTEEQKVTGTSDTKSAAQIKAILDGWADSRTRAKRILMKSLIGAFNSKRVFIEPGSYQVVSHIQDPDNPKQTTLTVRMTLVEG